MPRSLRVHDGHGSGHGVDVCVILLPARSNGLPLSVEVNSSLTVEVGSSPHGGLVSGEGEHGEWDWDGEVDSDLSGLDFVNEFTGDVSVLGEKSNTVTPRVGVDEVNSFLNGLDALNAHDGSEDLFVVAVHSGVDVHDDGGSNPVSVGVSFNLDITSIEEKFGVLFTIGNEVVDGLEESLVVGGSNIGVFGSGSDGKGLGLFNNSVDPVLSLSDEDNNGDSHASLSGGTETGTDQGVDSIFFVGISAYDGVVLGTHVDLASLSSVRGTFVDVFTGAVGTDEGYSADVFMVADVVNDGLSTLDAVNDTAGNTRLGEEIDDELSGVGDSLGRLDDEGVSGGDGHGVHPEGDHSGEVVGGNTSADTEGGSVRSDIDILGNVGKGLSLHERVERASVLSNFVTTEDISLGISVGLTVLPDNGGGEFVVVLLQEFLEVEHVADLLGDGNESPCLEGFSGVLNDGVELGFGGLGNDTDDILGEGADLFGPDLGLRLNPLSTDVVLVLS